MFKKLMQFEVFYQLKQRAFPLFAILFLALGVFLGRQGFAPKGINFNAFYQVYFYTGIFSLGSVFIIMFFAISAMLRDQQSNMESLIFSSSIKKFDYFWSRFLGTFIFSVLAFSPFLIGYMLGIHFSDLDPDRLGEFQWLTYFQPWLYIVLPNIFICSTLIFSVSTLTKNNTATYVSAVFIYMLYFVSSIFLNSPIMAQAVPASPESMAMAAIADPFGIAAFIEQTQYWTPYQKNTQLLSFTGFFLWNRLVWLLVSVGILLTTYRLFSFRKVTKKVKNEKEAKVSESPVFKYQPIRGIHTLKAQLMAFFFLLKLELKSVFKSLPFIAVLIMWLFIAFVELYATAVKGGEYGVSVYPFTSELIGLLDDALTLFSLILIVFYSADIVWKERSLNFNLIVDATPVKNWVFFMSKFFAVLLLPIILISTGIAMSIAFQLALGYSDYEFNLYGSVYYHYGLQLAVFSMIAMFINSWVKNKYAGMGLFGLIVILCMKSDVFGLEHPLSSLGFLPRVSYSNMNGFYDGSTLYDHLAIYWFAFGLMLTVLSFKIWNRGTVVDFGAKSKQLVHNWNKNQKIILSVLVLSLVASGSLVFYKANIEGAYITINDQMDLREDYERKFKKYDSIDRLIPMSKKTKVDFYPKERSYAVAADYILKNKSGETLSELFITERVTLERISVENARLISHDTVHDTYVFRYNKPLQPNDSVRCEFELKKDIKGYEEDNSIVNNGTYINGFSNFEPILGYTTGLEISDKTERKKRNLPEKEQEDDSDAHIILEDVQYEKIEFETIISTDLDQTALSSGRLVKQWSTHNRNFFHYKASEKILPEIGYFSAKYSTKKVEYKGVSIEQYYDENHNFNIDDIEKSVIHTLDYCQKNFGTYIFDHIRIAEVPSFWPFGGFAHPGMISMTEDRMYLNDVRNDETFNLVAKRTIHEVAHQWWGHTLTAKPVAGGSLFVEGFAKYTEAVVMEKMYGKRALYTLSDNARRRYFSGRSMANEIEPPLYKVLGQGYISYGKAYTVMLGLRDLIGERQVNKALKSLTDKYRYINKFEVNTIDLLNEIYKVTPRNQHVLIDDWFKKIITYDLAVEQASYKALADGRYEISVHIKAKRFETMANEEIKQIGIHEPIKIGVFTKHPMSVKDKSSILYYESSDIDDENTALKIIVKDLPKYIAIDPFGTRCDENAVNNLFNL